MILFAKNRELKDSNPNCFEIGVKCEKYHKSDLFIFIELAIFLNKNAGSHRIDFTGIPSVDL